MNAFDIDAAAQRLETHILSLQNTKVDPPEPLVRSVFDLVDDSMRNDNVPHPLPSVGMIHDDELMKANDLLSGGFEQEGKSTWAFVVMCDSPVRGQGMRGPRGAMTVSGLLADGLNNFIVDGPDGSCQMSVIQRKRWAPPNENAAAMAAYVLVVTHPVTVS